MDPVRAESAVIRVSRAHIYSIYILSIGPWMNKPTTASGVYREKAEEPGVRSPAFSLTVLLLKIPESSRSGVICCVSFSRIVTPVWCGLVFYETIKRKLKRRLIYECRCDERLKTKAEGSTRLTYTGFHGGLEHLKTETRLIDERFASVIGECEIVTLKVHRLYSK